MLEATTVEEGSVVALVSRRAAKTRCWCQTAMAAAGREPALAV
jgi:hypothetical protein